MIEAKALATKIVKKLTAAGYTAYFAGGWVRDFVMKHPSSDVDIATDAPPEKILELFPNTIQVGLAFGVVIVMMDGHQFEVATFRKDLEYIHGRRPEKIEFCTAQEDAYRRDFTINGMFYDPLEDQIHDYIHGMEDIKKGIIRAIGDANERFVEDRLRMIRAVRFAVRFGFKIDLETERAIQKNAHTLFPAVAIERVWQEFNKMAQFPNFNTAMTQMHQLGLLSVIFPDLKDTEFYVIEERIAHFPNFPKHCPTILFLLELFPEIQKEEATRLCEHLKTSNQDLKLAQLFCRCKELLETDPPPEDWVYFYAEKGSELCVEVLAARKDTQSAEKHRQDFLPYIKRIQQKNPIITAASLQSEGIPPGIVMGKLLKEAEKIAINSRLNTSQDVLIQLKQTPLWPKERS